MIEDIDVVLDCAQETGYRLCSDESEAGNESIFSASWDCNIADRMLICCQDGLLRVISSKSEVSKCFRLKFRPFTISSEEACVPGKKIFLHWDKLATIPDRPGELLFLLGVSRTVMYTALPGSESAGGFMSDLTRNDFGDFIYGTPTMEVFSHSFRITAMAANHTGNVLATGDEQGSVGLLLLRLLDQLAVKQRASRVVNATHQTAPVFTRVIPQYKILFTAHTGPIFSLQWLPVTTTFGEDSREYVLATGSKDCIVRVWRVTCSSTTGISVAPLLTLDFIPSSILSMNAYGLQLDAYSQIPSYIYLSAGTNFGIIYVWSFKYQYLTQLLEKRGFSETLDDGKKLHSVVQVGDKPIVHISMSGGNKSSARIGGRVVIATCDSAGVVHMFCESDEGDNDNSAIEAVDDAASILDSKCVQPTKRLPTYYSPSQMLEKPFKLAFRPNFGTFVHCGEAMYTASAKGNAVDRTSTTISLDPAIACCFDNLHCKPRDDPLLAASSPVKMGVATLSSIENLLTNHRTEGKIETTAMASARSADSVTCSDSEPNLLVCTSSGHMSIYPYSALEALYAKRLDTPIPDTGKLSNEDSLNPEMVAQALIESSSTSSGDERGPSRTRMDKKMPVVTAINFPPPPEPLPKVATDKLKSTRSGVHKSSKRQSPPKGVVVSNNDDEEEAQPRSLPPPVPISSKKYVEVAGAKPNPVPKLRLASGQETNLDVQKSNEQPTIMSNDVKEVRIGGRSQSSPKIEMPVLASGDRILQSTVQVSENPSPFAASSAETLLNAPTHTPETRSQESRKKIVPPQQIPQAAISPVRPILEANVPPMPVAPMPASGQTRNGNARSGNPNSSLISSESFDLAILDPNNPPHEQNQAHKVQPRRNLRPSSDSLLSSPGIHSSKAVYAKLVEAQQFLETEENISVQTSSTDRHIAAKRSTRSSPLLDRYDGLTPLLADNHDQNRDPRLPILTRAKKQVDPDWLLRRQLGGPDRSDLNLLKLDDPSVRIRFDHSEEPANGVFPLQATINSTTLQPQFTLNMKFSDVFGNPWHESLELWEQTSHDREEQTFDRICSLTSF